MKMFVYLRSVVVYELPQIMLDFVNFLSASMEPRMRTLYFPPSLCSGCLHICNKAFIHASIPGTAVPILWVSLENQEVICQINRVCVRVRGSKLADRKLTKSGT